MARDHERYTEDVAPYVLGALAPLEAEALEKHLRVCEDCQRELVDLRPGAEILSRAVEQIDPPASLRTRILEQVAAEAGTAEAPVAPPRSLAPASTSGFEHGGALRRAGARLRQAGARAGASLVPPRPAVVAATGLVALVAGVAGWSLGGAGTTDDRTVTASVDRERLPRASARLTVPGGGEDSVLRLAGLGKLGPERTYEVWVQRDGKLAPGPLFTPTADGSAVTGVPGSAKEIEAVFVTRERAGGAPTPTESPVVSIPLSS